MELLEDKLNGQISRVTQHSDRLRDAAFSRVDAKMGSMEVLQPKLDRRLAELSGNCKGLSDEMQAQIRRIDQMDSRLWECRHQIEEEVRGKFAEVEQTCVQMDSRVRTEKAATDDIIKKYNRRLLRLEALEERMISLDVSHEDTRQNLEHLHGRLLDMEQCRVQDLALCSYPPASQPLQAPESGVDLAAFEALESRLGDCLKRMETMQQDFTDVHSRLEAQEERSKILRTQMDSREENYQKLKDRVERADWESRLKEIAQQVKEMDQYKVSFAEQFTKLDLLQKKMDFQEQTVEELQRLQKERVVATPLRAEEWQTQEWHAPASEEPVANGDSQVFSLELRDCAARCRSTETRLEEVCGELQAIRMDLELAPRVTALVDQLKQVAPKVIDQEQVVQELHEKVGRMEVRMGLGSSRGDLDVSGEVPQAAAGSSAALDSKAALLDSLGVRVDWLEVETRRLKEEIEGPGPDAPGILGSHAASD
jgi:predicted  nucleic acid-binding Zn-ribbon protein